MGSETEGEALGDEGVHDKPRPRRAAGGHSHGGEDAEGEEGKNDVPGMRRLTREALLAAGRSGKVGGGRNWAKTSTASGGRRRRGRHDWLASGPQS